VPNYGQNDNLPNYGRMVMVKGHDDNSQRIPLGISSKIQLKTNKRKIIKCLHKAKLRTYLRRNRFAFIESFLLSNRVINVQLHTAQKELYLNGDAKNG